MKNIKKVYIKQNNYNNVVKFSKKQRKAIFKK